MRGGRKMREFGFRGDAVEVFVLVGIMGDCVIEVSNVQIQIIGLYSLEEETLYAFYETSGTNHLLTRRHIPEGRSAQVRTHEWEKGVACTKMVSRGERYGGCQDQRKRGGSK